MLSRSFVVFLTVSLVISSFPPIGLGEESYLALKMTDDVTINSETEVSVTLKKETIIYTNDTYKEDGYSLQFGEKEIVIPSESVELEEDLTTTYTDFVGNTDNLQEIGEISTLQEDPIILYDSEHNSIGELKGEDYPVSNEDVDYYQIHLGNRVFFIDKKDTNSVFIPNETVDVVTPNTSEDSVEQIVPVEKEILEEQQLAEDEIEDREEEVLEEKVLEEKETIKKSETNEEVINDSVKQSRTTTSSSVPKSPKARTFVATIAEKVFTADIKYFKVVQENVPVYDNRSGSLVEVGYLKEGEEYPRTNTNNSQNWHEIKFGDFTGYVRVSSTEPSSGSTITNLNTKYKNSGRTLTTLQDVVVYDNTRSGLIPFATIKKGQSYPILTDYSNWYRIDVAGKVGYVRKSEIKTDFLKDDLYFKVDQENVPVYDNRSGSLVTVGYLENGEIYPRTNTNNSQNWHEIKFGHFTGYVNVDSTQPDSGKSITNLNTKYKNSSRTLTTIQDVVVYDNTKGGLIPFATIKKGQSYPILSDYSNWYRIDVAGKVGYVRKNEIKADFLESDRYFRVITDEVPVYDNRTGSLVQIGTLTKDQVYPRVSDYGNWHQIQFGNFYGYIKKDLTMPDTGKVLKNENKIYNNQPRILTALKDVPVYDNTSGSLVEFGEILEGQKFPIATDFGNWWRIVYSDRVGYVKKDIAFSGVYKEISYTNYDYTLSQMVNKQMNARPQTDKYDYEYGYVSGGYLKDITSGSFPKTGVVTASTLNIRSWNTVSSETLGFAEKDTKLTLVAKFSNGWYKVKYPGSWSDAKSSDVNYYVNPENFVNNIQSMYQFLTLTKSAGVSESELNALLKGKGILEGKADAFITASKLYNINEIYLVSHALLETGNGKSTLAKGSSYKGKTVYNMFGIGAYDGKAVKTGSAYAYNAKWFTPEEAIIGGAKFIGDGYINSSTYKQDTLYKMRWNPYAPATHQYATDIGWAYKQTANIANLYSQLYSYTLFLDIPKYK